MRDHRKLKAFALADQLALLIYDATRSFPEDERFGLTAQMRRAAVSIPANIVEACARYSEADYLRMLVMAYGSAKELQYEVSLAKRLEYLDSIMAERTTCLATQTVRTLSGLVTSIRRRR